MFGIILFSLAKDSDCYLTRQIVSFFLAHFFSAESSSSNQCQDNKRTRVDQTCQHGRQEATERHLEAFVKFRPSSSCRVRHCYVQQLSELFVLTLMWPLEYQKSYHGDHQNTWLSVLMWLMNRCCIEEKVKIFFTLCPLSQFCLPHSFLVCDVFL